MAAVDDPIEQDRRAVRVPGDVGADRVHRLADPDHGRQVDDHGCLRERAVHGPRVSDRAVDELDGLREELRLDRPGPVHLGIETVEHADRRAPCDQRLDEMRADEPGAARDQHPLSDHRPPPSVKRAMSVA